MHVAVEIKQNVPAYVLKKPNEIIESGIMKLPDFLIEIPTEEYIDKIFIY